MRRRPILATLLGALVIAAAVPALAAADSIVYIKGSNVWIANTDGTGAYQVTLDGTADSPYYSPSQANDGALMAIKGSGTTAKFHHLRQNGDLIDPPFDHSAPAHPHDAQLSPDGTKIAYHWIGLTNNCYPYSCIAGWPKTFFSYSNRFTPGEEITAGVNFQNPSWMSNSRVYLSYGASNTYTYDIGAPDATIWFGNSETTVYDADLDATNSRIVVIGNRDSGNPETLRFFQSTGAPPAEPDLMPCFLTDPTGGSFDDPTFAPDGGALAWAEGDGIWRMTIGTFTSTACGAEFGSGSLIIPGGSEPDWGPANVNPGPRTPPPPPPGPAPGPGSGPGPRPVGSADTTPPSLTGLSLAPRTFRAARTGPSVGPRGLRIRFDLSEAATATFSVERSVDGRRLRGRCVAPARAPRSARRCKRLVSVKGTFTHAAISGENRVTFSGRVGGRRLSPGSYRLVLQASDAAGNRSGVLRAPFRVKR